MDCVTTRLQTEIGISSVLDPEISKEVGRIGEILFSGPWTEKTFRKKGRQKFRNFPEKM